MTALAPTLQAFFTERLISQRRVSAHTITAYRDTFRLLLDHTHQRTPHVLRHTAAMRLLHAGVDPATIALWLGHERVDTTMIYVHADLAIKERALARTTPPGITARRYRPNDKLLAFLAGL